MKKSLCLLCALLFLCAAKAAGAEGAYAFMTETAGRMAGAVAQCAASAEYLGFFTSSEDVIADAAAYAGHLSGKAQAAYLLRTDPERMLSVLAGETQGLPDLARQNLLRRMPGAMMTQLISQEGAQAVAVSNILQLSDTFAAPEGLEDGDVLILAYGEAAVCCIFSVSGFGSAGCTAMPMAWNDTVRGNLAMMSQLGLFTLEQIPADGQ
ncbi:MAG: hypothetical protein J5564_08085 [Clostridia bacterium]|nr:hypothetical protein [Clostridia bacterium]